MPTVKAFLLCIFGSSCSSLGSYIRNCWCLRQDAATGKALKLEAVLSAAVGLWAFTAFVGLSFFIENPGDLGQGILAPFSSKNLKLGKTLGHPPFLGTDVYTFLKWLRNLLSSFLAGRSVSS